MDRREYLSAPRATARYLGDSRVEYTYPCGHTWRETLLIGPGRGRTGKHKRPMAPDMAAKLVRHWAANGVNAGPCPKCRRQKRLEQHGAQL